MMDKEPKADFPDRDKAERAGKEEPDQTASLATMRHKLRTPLNHIIGYSEMLLEEAGERKLEGFAADIEKIRTAGKQLLTLINDLLDPSPTHAGSPRLTSEAASPSASFRDKDASSPLMATEPAPTPETPSSHLLVVGLQMFKHLVPIHFRHLDIKEYQVNRLGVDQF